MFRKEEDVYNAEDVYRVTITTNIHEGSSNVVCTSLKNKSI